MQPPAPTCAGQVAQGSVFQRSGCLDGFRRVPFSRGDAGALEYTEHDGGCRFKPMACSSLPIPLQRRLPWPGAQSSHAAHKNHPLEGHRGAGTGAEVPLETQKGTSQPRHLASWGSPSLLPAHGCGAVACRSRRGVPRKGRVLPQHSGAQALVPAELSPFRLSPGDGLLW